MGDVHVVHHSELVIKGHPYRTPVSVSIPSHTIDKIASVEKIAPVAVHLKEVNQIDPISIDSLRCDTGSSSSCSCCSSSVRSRRGGCWSKPMAGLIFESISPSCIILVGMRMR